MERGGRVSRLSHFACQHVDAWRGCLRLRGGGGGDKVRGEGGDVSWLDSQSVVEVVHVLTTLVQGVLRCRGGIWRDQYLYVDVWWMFEQSVDGGRGGSDE